jgi:imidazole glycerol-phosphate synthase subunit HisH
MKVCLVDYGIGNVASVFNSLRRLQCEAVVVADGERLKVADPAVIILPGVGAIGKAMANLTARGLVDTLNELVITKSRKFLGICVGMQIMTERGEEFGTHDCLGWIPGSTSRLAARGSGVQLPHVGWNTVEPTGEDGLFSGLSDQHFYFCHSYAVRCPDEFVIARTEYNRSFVAAVRKHNIHGVQFHPEKSSRAGQALLQNFLLLPD